MDPPLIRALREALGDDAVHAGDGNLHRAMGRPKGVPDVVIRVEREVYALVARYGGSISAEHGIGVKRLPYLGHTRTPAKIALMQALEQTMDPRGTLNPGRMPEARRAA